MTRIPIRLYDEDAPAVDVVKNVVDREDRFYQNGFVDSQYHEQPPMYTGVDDHGD